MKPQSLILDSQSTLPPKINDRAAWYGAELAESGEWVERVSEAEVREVESAIEQLHEVGSDLARITLPTLLPRLQRILDEVMNGRGFVLIKGLPVERWTKREAAVAFLVIGVQLGNLRMQNAEG